MVPLRAGLSTLATMFTLTEPYLPNNCIPPDKGPVKDFLRSGISAEILAGKSREIPRSEPTGRPLWLVHQGPQNEQTATRLSVWPLRRLNGVSALSTVTSYVSPVMWRSARLACRA